MWKERAPPDGIVRGAGIERITGPLGAIRGCIAGIERGIAGITRGMAGAIGWTWLTLGTV